MVGSRALPTTLARCGCPACRQELRRLITASLRAYDGAEREQVVALFAAFAIFPEDVPVPRGLFDLLSRTFFGASGKRPHLKVRSWLTALLRLSLLQGSPVMLSKLFFIFPYASPV